MIEMIHCLLFPASLSPPACLIQCSHSPKRQLPCWPQRTEDERFEARQEAARNAVNIDDQERRRRIIFGGALLVRICILIAHSASDFDEQQCALCSPSSFDLDQHQCTSA